MSGPELAAAIDGVVDRAAAVQWHNLDAVTREATERAVQDALGVAAGGAVAPGVAATLESYRRVAGRGGTVLPWWDARLGPADAAMALSLLIHAWDFDDTHDRAVVHACCIALPAALVAAHAAGVGGDRLLAGVVAGVEVICRVSLALGPQPGVIRTAGLGSLGAAAAAARTLGLPAAGMREALALAVPMTMSPTSRQVVADGAISKRHQPGFAVRHGVTAAFLAHAGVTGPAGWFTGAHGLGALVPDEAAACAELAAPGWEVTRLSLKPYPACRYTHAAIAGVLELGSAGVDRVRVHLPEGSHHVLVARPWARRGQPVIDAQFSVPWAVGAALHTGTVDLQTLAGPSLLDPAIEQRARRVQVLQDRRPAGSVLSPVRVVAIAADGAERACDVEDVPGSPTRPLDRDALVAKTRGCLLAAGHPASLADTLADVVGTLGNLDGAALPDALLALAPPTLQPLERT